MFFPDAGAKLLKHTGDKIAATEDRILSGLPDWTAYQTQIARLNELREMDGMVRRILGRDDGAA